MDQCSARLLYVHTQCPGTQGSAHTVPAHSSEMGIAEHSPQRVRRAAGILPCLGASSSGKNQIFSPFNHSTDSQTKSKRGNG